MADKVRIGIVGTSWWADLMHLPASKSHPTAELVAICGRNRDRAREMAEKYQIAQVFTDYQEMITHGGIDGIVVSVPDDLHYEITIKAIEAGVHVLCEKPLAMSAGQAREMYEKAEKANIKHMTCFTHRWMPATRYLRRLITEGYIGRCLSAEFRYVSGGGRGGDYKWRFDRKRSLGALGDFGAHMIDLAFWLVGEISTVGAHLMTSVNRHGPDGEALDSTNDSALLLTEFQNGGHGVINVSKVAHIGDRGQEFRIVLHGEKGTLEVDSNMRDGYKVYGAKNDEKKLTAHRIPDDILCGIDQDSPVMQQLQQVFTEQPAGCRLFVDAIAEDRKISPSFYDGLQAQKVIAAAIESDKRRQFVSL